VRLGAAPVRPLRSGPARRRGWSRVRRGPPPSCRTAIRPHTCVAWPPPSGGALLEAAHGVVGKVVEAGVFAEELELDRAGRAVTLLADDDFGKALVRRVFLVVVLVAVDE